MRKFLVHRFALYYVIGKVNFPRISTIMAPALLLAAISQMNGLSILSYIFLGIFAFGAWLGFSWFGAGYFELWPVKREELTDSQKEQFDAINYGRSV